MNALRRHPTGFWYVFWAEGAERASYYGMRAILALYMVERLGFSEADSASAMSLFIGACYCLPLLGGLVADRWLGKYRTILAFSAPYIAGHLLLGVESVAFLWLSLALLALGAGAIKPNASTLMGMIYDQQRPGDSALRSDAFGLYYMAVNIGAALAQLALPSLRSALGYQVAFAFPAALMVVAFALFAAGKQHYAPEAPARREHTPAERAEQRATLGRLGALFALVMFFWAIYDQSASTWIFFARSHMRLELLGFRIEPDAIQALNPLLILLLVPTFAALWRALAARGVRVAAADKMLLGFALATAAVGVQALAGWLASDGVRVTVLWQAAAYLLLTMAEVCISVVGLELAFSAAPKHMQSFVTAAWLLCVALGNWLINAPIVRLYGELAPGAFFGLLTALMIPVTALFWRVARRLEAGAAG